MQNIQSIHNIPELIQKLRQNRSSKAWSQTLESLSKIKLDQISVTNLYSLLDEFFIAAFYSHDIPLAVQILKEFSRTHVDDHIINNTDHLLKHLRTDKTVVATLDPHRKPEANEIVICYGDYPHDVSNLVFNNPIRRHLKYFWNLTHDRVEYDSIWDPIDAIYIINLTEREDRYIETLRELRRMAAPLDRVHRFSAIKYKSNDFFTGTLGCAKSHLSVIRSALEKGYHNILVLEDDFCFTEDLTTHRESLKTFFERKYSYDVCLLATSKYYRTEDHDDLLKRSYQECTTCAGYLLSAEGMAKLIPIWDASLPKLLETRDTNKYACDRSWSVLQKDNKFFIFKPKMGFQRPNYSSITGTTTFYMD